MQDTYNVGVYARLSRDDERTGESVSIENQKELLAQYVKEQGWNLYSYYCDDGVSGTTFDRPQFNRLVQDATDGKINLVLCKDLSRLGRDYIEAGRYTDYIFPSLGCRFIALNDGVDTIHKNNEMMVILKNVMNDLYARDTSNKIKAVRQSTFKAGKFISAYAPYGYMKSPEDKHKLIPDPVTAPIVRRIFNLRAQGNGHRKIAIILNEDGIPSPRTYYYMVRGQEHHSYEMVAWSDMTVRSILRNEVYIGHLVQNKTGHISYKNHKQVSKPREEWIKVENTHEPLIEKELWDFVQATEDRLTRGRSGKNGMVSLFADVLRCMDCGGAMRFSTDYRKRKNGKPSEYKAYLCNRYMSGGRQACSPHYINQRLLVELVTLDIRAKAIFAQNNPDELKAKLLNKREAASVEQTKAMQTALTALDKRLAELEKLVQAVYEDKVMGRIPEAICVKLLKQYEAERAEKLESKQKLSAKIAESAADTKSIDDWLNVIQDYAQLETLDRPTLVRLINRIEVGEKSVVDGVTERTINIYYNFVGYVEL